MAKGILGGIPNWLINKIDKNAEDIASIGDKIELNISDDISDGGILPITNWTKIAHATIPKGTYLVTVFVNLVSDSEANLYSAIGKTASDLIKSDSFFTKQRCTYLSEIITLHQDTEIGVYGYSTNSSTKAYARVIEAYKIKD